MNDKPIPCCSVMLKNGTQCGGYSRVRTRIARTTVHLCLYHSNLMPGKISVNTEGQAFEVEA